MIFRGYHKEKDRSKMAEQETMALQKFMKTFNTEQACREHLCYVSYVIFNWGTNSFSQVLKAMFSLSVERKPSSGFLVKF